MEILITNQEQLDAIPLDQTGEIKISGGTKENPIIILKHYQNANVYLIENAVVTLIGSATVQNMYDKSTVHKMWDNSTVQKMRDYSTVQNMYGNSTVHHMCDNSTVHYMYDNSTVHRMYNNSTVHRMYRNSTVHYMYDNSNVQYMLGNSTVQNMNNNSTVQNMLDNSNVQYMLGNSTIQSMRSNSTVQYMRYNSTVQNMRENSTVGFVYSDEVKITCNGQNIVKVLDYLENNNISMNEDSILIKIKTFRKNPTVDFFIKQYGIEQRGEDLVLYKALHKKEDGTYFSDYRNDFTYFLGETKENECDQNNENSCSFGLHVGTLDFAKQFGRWKDLAIVEVLVPIEGIVVSKDCDDKVRCSKLTVLKEI